MEVHVCPHSSLPCCVHHVPYKESLLYSNESIYSQPSYVIIDYSDTESHGLHLDQSTNHVVPSKTVLSVPQGLPRENPMYRKTHHQIVYRWIKRVGTPFYIMKFHLMAHIHLYRRYTRIPTGFLSCLKIPRSRQNGLCIASFQQRVDYTCKTYNKCRIGGLHSPKSTLQRSVSD